MSFGPLHTVQLLNLIDHEFVEPLLIGSLHSTKMSGMPQQAAACRTPSSPATAATMSRALPGLALIRTYALMPHLSARIAPSRIRRSPLRQTSGVMDLKSRMRPILHLAGLASKLVIDT